jgi:hypothetical protein
MTKTLDEQASAVKPKPLPAVPEVAMRLYLRTVDNHQNQFRGSTVGRSVVLRVYIGHDAAEAYQGEVLVVSTADAFANGDAKRKDGKDGPIFEFIWRDVSQKGDVVMAWAPVGAAITGFKALL